MLNVFHFCRNFLFFFLSRLHITQKMLSHADFVVFHYFCFQSFQTHCSLNCFVCFFLMSHGWLPATQQCRPSNPNNNKNENCNPKKKKTRWKKTKKKKSETQDGGTGVMGRWKRLKITWSTFFVEQINTDREWRIAIMMIIIMKLKSRVSSFEGTNGTRRLF